MFETDTHAFDRVAAFKAVALVRRFEQRLLDLFAEGKLMGTTHTCLGQEANAVGIAASLRRDDVVISNHRGHGHFLAHVGDVEGLMAEIMGRETGICGGWGGSQHLCVPGAFYSNGIQGGIAPLALGIALAEKMDGSDQVAAVFLGDGTMGQGVVYEAMNIAAIRKAPVLFVIEDNGIAQTTPTTRTTAGRLEGRGQVFDIPAHTLSYPTAEEIHAVAVDLVAEMRRGEGPRALVIESARLGPHSKGDDTRPPEEIARLQALDPVKRMEDALPAEAVEAAWQVADAKIEAAYTQAEKAQAAVLGEAAARGKVDLTPVEASLEGLDGKTQREQINDALHSLMADSEEVVLLGEDLLDPYGGAFKVTVGLSDAHPERVLQMPISEAAMVGLAGGMALHGRRPVVEIMFGDFVTLAMDQLVNHLARYPGMYNGQVRVPVVVRTPMGGGRGYGPTHSQTLDKHFLGVSGLQVLAPSALHPIGDMLEGASRAAGPTLFIENKVAYNHRVMSSGPGMVGDFFVRYAGEQEAPWVVLSLTEFEGDQMTILCYGGLLPRAMEAAVDVLMDSEIAVRLVLPGRLYPLDGEALAALVASDGGVLAVEEGAAPFGFGAEVGAALAEIGRLGNRPFRRLGALELTIGAARTLEDAILPSAADIGAAIRELVEQE